MRIGKRRFAAAVVGAVVMAGAVGANVRAQDQDLPEGPGKAELLDACASCHDTGIITGQRHTTDEWSEVVTRMAGLGATVSDAQSKAIVDYLSAHYAPANAAAVAAPPAAAPASAKASSSAAVIDPPAKPQ